MKKLILFLIPFMLLSCGVDHSKFEGKWIDKSTEADILDIKQNGKNYIVEYQNKKYPAKLNDDLLEITTTFPLKAIIDNNDILIVDETEYIRFNKSKKRKFIGIWEPSHYISYKKGEIDINGIDDLIKHGTETPIGNEFHEQVFLIKSNSSNNFVFEILEIGQMKKFQKMKFKKGLFNGKMEFYDTYSKKTVKEYVTFGLLENGNIIRYGGNTGTVYKQIKRYPKE